MRLLSKTNAKDHSNKKQKMPREKKKGKMQEKMVQSSLRIQSIKAQRDVITEGKRENKNKILRSIKAWLKND